jgi:large subunit ribosomal protein L25
MAGGRLELQYRRVPVIGLPKDLPEFVGVDISNLEIGQNVRVRDLSVPNCTVLLSDSTLLAAVQQTRAAMAAAAAAAASK